MAFGIQVLGGTLANMIPATTTQAGETTTVDRIREAVKGFFSENNKIVVTALACCVGIYLMYSTLVAFMKIFITIGIFLAVAISYNYFY